MTFAWFLVLVGYGVMVGWEDIPNLAWLLLGPMIVQDHYDARHTRA
jgi:hypothetical protein